MDRRSFLSIAKFLAIPFVFSFCSREGKENITDYINHLLNELLEYYNRGQVTKKLNLFFDTRCLFVDGKPRTFQELEEHLTKVYNYHEKYKIIPLSAVEPKIVVHDSIAQVVCKLKSQTQNIPYGLLTLIYVKNQNGWKILHHHLTESKLYVKKF